MQMKIYEAPKLLSNHKFKMKNKGMKNFNELLQSVSAPSKT